MRHNSLDEEIRRLTRQVAEGGGLPAALALVRAHVRAGEKLSKTDKETLGAALGKSPAWIAKNVLGINKVYIVTEDVQGNVGISPFLTRREARKHAATIRVEYIEQEADGDPEYETAAQEARRQLEQGDYQAVFDIWDNEALTERLEIWIRTEAYNL